MDVQHFLAVNMMVASALIILTIVVQSGARHNVLWIAVNTIIVVIGFLALRFSPQSAGIIVGSVFAPFVLVPFALGILANRNALQGRLRRTASSFA